jgi:hypothetical protein
MPVAGIPAEAECDRAHERLVTNDIDLSDEENTKAQTTRVPPPSSAHDFLTFGDVGDVAQQCRADLYRGRERRLTAQCFQLARV